MAPSGFISVLTGWITAEVGRQPWIIYDQLKTAVAVSPLTLGEVITTIGLMVIVYGIIFCYFFFKYFFRTIEKGPVDFDVGHPPFTYLNTQQNIKGARS